MWIKAMFTLTVLKLLLFERRSVLASAQRGTGSKMVNFSVKNQENIWLLLKLLERLGGFEYIYIFNFV